MSRNKRWFFKLGRQIGKSRTTRNMIKYHIENSTIFEILCLYLIGLGATGSPDGFNDAFDDGPKIYELEGSVICLFPFDCTEGFGGSGEVLVENKDCFDKWSKSPLRLPLPSNMDEFNFLIEKIRFIGSEEGGTLSDNYDLWINKYPTEGE